MYEVQLKQLSKVIEASIWQKS